MRTPILFVIFNLAVIYAQGTQRCNYGPSRLRPDSCCRHLPSFARIELIKECNMEDLYGENHSETPSCEPFNCIMQRNGFLDGNNKINRLNIRSSVYSQYPPEWATIIETALNNCFTQLDSGSQCEAKTFAFCFVHHMLLNCPQNYWTLSKSCDDAKLFLQNCIPPAM